MFLAYKHFNSKMVYLSYLDIYLAYHLNYLNFKLVFVLVLPYIGLFSMEIYFWTFRRILPLQNKFLVTAFL